MKIPTSFSVIGDDRASNPVAKGPGTSIVVLVGVGSEVDGSSVELSGGDVNPPVSRFGDQVVDIIFFLRQFVL